MMLYSVYLGFKIVFLHFVIFKVLYAQIFENLTPIIGGSKARRSDYASLAMTYYRTTFKYKKHICEILNCSLYPSKDYKIVEKTLASSGLLVTSCGRKNVYFSKSKSGSPLDSWRICCAVGMEPFLMENKNELECLNKAVSSSGVIKSTNSKYIFQTGWFDHFFDRNFRECPGKSGIPQDVWSPNEPNNNGNIEACITVTFSKTTDIIGLADVPCVVQIPIACQIVVDESNKIKSKSSIYNENKQCASELSTPRPSLGCSLCLTSECRQKYEEIYQKVGKILSFLKQKQRVVN